MAQWSLSFFKSTGSKTSTHRLSPVELPVTFSHVLHAYRSRKPLYPCHRRQRMIFFWLAALASFLAICFFVITCGFLRASRTLRPSWRRMLAGGKETQSPQSSSTSSEDSCHSVSSHADVPRADGRSSSSPFQAAAAEAEPEKQPQRKRKRKTSMGDSRENQWQVPELASPLVVSLSPQLDAYIAQALEREEELEVADWLLDLEQDIPPDPCSEGEKFASWPGEGTRASTKFFFQAAREQRTEQPPDSSTSPGEGTGVTPRTLLQAAQELQTDQPLAGGNGGGMLTRGSSVLEGCC